MKNKDKETISINIPATIEVKGSVITLSNDNDTINSITTMILEDLRKSLAFRVTKIHGKLPRRCRYSSKGVSVDSTEQAKDKIKAVLERIPIGQREEFLKIILSEK